MNGRGYAKIIVGRPMKLKLYVLHPNRESICSGEWFMTIDDPIMAAL